MFVNVMIGFEQPYIPTPFYVEVDILSHLQEPAVMGALETVFGNLEIQKFHSTANYAGLVGRFFETESGQYALPVHVDIIGYPELSDFWIVLTHEGGLVVRSAGQMKPYIHTAFERIMPASYIMARLIQWLEDNHVIQPDSSDSCLLSDNQTWMKIDKVDRLQYLLLFLEDVMDHPVDEDDVESIQVQGELSIEMDDGTGFVVNADNGFDYVVSESRLNFLFAEQMRREKELERLDQHGESMLIDMETMPTVGAA